MFLFKFYNKKEAESGGVAGAWNLRKRANASISMFLWRIYAATVRATPSELGDKLILVLRQPQNMENPGLTKDFPYGL